MRASIKFILPSVATVLMLSACGSSSSTSSNAPAPAGQPRSAKSVSANALVKTAANSKLGATVLVDAQRMTLYRLSGEQPGKFICASAGCLKVWHPLLASGSSAPSGTVGSLGTVKRPGIGEQVTYKGMPLYTFAQDTAAGQANGQGIKDVGVWNAVTASASAASTPAAPTQPASSGGGGSPY
jgi:predicted lipoprotein with Yx(FWY)xxD motif